MRAQWIIDAEVGARPRPARAADLTPSLRETYLALVREFESAA
jgi:hypothetical protein